MKHYTVILFVLVFAAVLGCEDDPNAGNGNYYSGGDTDTDTDSDSDGDADGDADGDVDGDSDSDTDADTDADSDSDTDADTDADADGDSDSDTDGDSDSDADSDGDADSDSDGDGDSNIGCEGMDILFVVDDSGSMSEEQANLATNFPQFINVLDNYETTEGEPLEYRVGVTTTGVNRNFKTKILNVSVPMTSAGPSGKLLGQDTAPAPNCGLTEPWLSGPGANVASTFSCMAEVGTSGSGTEMPFAALEGALGEVAPFKSAPGGLNEGFYRKDKNTLLVVVIITDEDDCSISNGGIMTLGLAGGSNCNAATSTGLYTPDQMVTFMDDLTGGSDRYVVVGIGGPNACNSSFGSAAQARRLNLFTDACEFGVFGNICAGDLWISLQEALDVMTIACDEMGPIV